MNEGKELGPPNWLPLETKLRESGRPSVCAWRSCGCGGSGELTSTNTPTHVGICFWIQIAGAGGKVPANLSLQISSVSFIA